MQRFLSMYLQRLLKRWNDYRNINAKPPRMIRGSGSNVYSKQIDRRSCDPEAGRMKSDKIFLFGGVLEIEYIWV